MPFVVSELVDPAFPIEPWNLAIDVLAGNIKLQFLENYIGVLFPGSFKEP